MRRRSSRGDRRLNMLWYRYDLSGIFKPAQPTVRNVLSVSSDELMACV